MMSSAPKPGRKCGAPVPGFWSTSTRIWIPMSRLSSGRFRTPIENVTRPRELDTTTLAMSAAAASSPTESWYARCCVAARAAAAPTARAAAAATTTALRTAAGMAEVCAKDLARRRAEPFVRDVEGAVGTDRHRTREAEPVDDGLQLAVALDADDLAAADLVRSREARVDVRHRLERVEAVAAVESDSEHRGQAAGVDRQMPARS